MPPVHRYASSEAIDLGMCRYALDADKFIEEKSAKKDLVVIPRPEPGKGRNYVGDPPTPRVFDRRRLEVDWRWLSRAPCLGATVQVPDAPTIAVGPSALFSRAGRGAPRDRQAHAAGRPIGELIVKFRTGGLERSTLHVRRARAQKSTSSTIVDLLFERGLAGPPTRSSTMRPRGLPRSLWSSR